MGGRRLQEVLPAVLHGDGRSPRGDPAHDHLEELWGHALHRWQGHGWDKEHPHVGGLIRRLRCTADGSEAHARAQQARGQVRKHGVRGEAGNERGYTSESDAKSRGLKIAKLSGTDFRKRLRSGEEFPDWFAFPAVVQTLRNGGESEAPRASARREAPRASPEANAVFTEHTKIVSVIK